MVATFDPALPDVKDDIRLELGDTTDGAMILQDETIVALHTKYADGNTATRQYQLTVLAAARATLAELSRRVTKGKVEGAVEGEWRERIPALKKMVARYALLTGDPGATAGYAASGTLAYGGSLLTPHDER